MLFYAELLPPTGSTGGGGSAVATTVLYKDRDTLRSAAGAAGDLVIIEDLGMFQYVTPTTITDDDETCFRSGVGGWVMVLPGWNKVYANLAGELDTMKHAGRLYSTPVPVSTIVSGESVTFTTQHIGELTDVLPAYVPNHNGFVSTIQVLSDETISVTVTNISSGSLSTADLVVQYTRLKGAPVS